MADRPRLLRGPDRRRAPEAAHRGGEPEPRALLQADAYSGYDGLYQSGGRVIEIGCWAHARRRFVDAFMTETSAALMIALIQQLYQVERDAADVDATARRALRQEDSVRLLAKIDAER